MDKSERNKRNMIIAGVVVFVIVSLYAIISWVITIGKAKVKIVYAPFDAVVEMDGKRIRNNAEHYLTPGWYKIEVKFDNFETLVGEVEVKNDTEYLFGSLEAANELGEEYVNDHMDEFLTIEGIAGYLSSKEGLRQREEILGKAPVVAKLPVKNSLFTISYLVGADDDGVKITFSASNSTMDSAVSKFKSLLDNDDRLSRYNIEFSGYGIISVADFKNNNEGDLAGFLKAGLGHIDGFSIKNTGESGGYYYATVTTGHSKFYNLATYRIILKNSEDGWKIVGGPAPILTQYNAGGVPIEVIDLANS